MKKGIAMLLTLVMMMTMIGSVSAAGNNVPSFKVDGRIFVTPTGEPQPYINKDNRTMGSLRLIANAVGVESKNIKWDNVKQTATLVRGENTVSVTVGKKAITVNGKSVTMDTVAEMKQGRVFIPARFIGQGLGVTVKFDGATNSVNFITGDNAVVNNNFADYGLTQVKELPIAIAAGGLEITYHDAFLYKTNSAEAKAIQDKYKLDIFEDSSHLLWMKVTITNKSTKTIARDYSDQQMKIGIKDDLGEKLSYAFSDQDDYLYSWVLEPNDSISGYVGHLKKNNNPINFIVLSTIHKNAINSVLIAEKVD